MDIPSSAWLRVLLVWICRVAGACARAILSVQVYAVGRGEFSPSGGAVAEVA